MEPLACRSGAPSGSRRGATRPQDRLLTWRGERRLEVAQVEPTAEDVGKPTPKEREWRPLTIATAILGLFGSLVGVVYLFGGLVLSSRLGLRDRIGMKGPASLTTNAVGIRRQAGRGADGCCAVDRVGRVVGAGRAAVAEGGAAFSLSGPQAACPTGRRCRGSCSCCTRGSPGGICRSSSASARARPAIGGWTSGSRRVCGSGCTRCLLAELRAAGELEWSRAVADSQSCAGEKGGSATGPSPVDRARNGSKHHLLVDATGIPLAWTVTGGNRNDVTQLIPLARARPAGARQGRPAAPPARHG